MMPAVIAGGTWTSVSLLKISSPLYFAFPCYRLKMSDLLEQDAYEAYSRGGGGAPRTHWATSSSLVRHVPFPPAGSLPPCLPPPAPAFGNHQPVLCICQLAGWGQFYFCFSFPLMSEIICRLSLSDLAHLTCACRVHPNAASNDKAPFFLYLSHIPSSM